MPEDHPDPQLLEHFRRGEAGPEERRGVIRHLLESGRGEETAAVLLDLAPSLLSGPG